MDSEGRPQVVHPWLITRIFAASNPRYAPKLLESFGQRDGINLLAVSAQEKIWCAVRFSSAPPAVLRKTREQIRTNRDTAPPSKPGSPNGDKSFLQIDILPQ